MKREKKEIRNFLPLNTFTNFFHYEMRDSIHWMDTSIQKLREPIGSPNHEHIGGIPSTRNGPRTQYPSLRWHQGSTNKAMMTGYIPFPPHIDKVNRSGPPCRPHGGTNEHLVTGETPWHSHGDLTRRSPAASGTQRGE